MSDYNGWKNYETWNVALWLDNEPETYHQARAIAAECIDDNEAAKALEAYVDEMKPELAPSMFSDLLGAALSEVDWIEIAEHYREDMETENDG